MRVPSWLSQDASNSTDVLDRPLPPVGVRISLTARSCGLSRRPASQFSRAVPSEPMLRSLTVILTRSPGARSSADAVMGCLRAAVR